MAEPRALATRVLVAVLTMFVISRLRGNSLAVPRPVRLRLFWAGAFNIAIWNVCTAYAVTLIPSGHAAVIEKPEEFVRLVTSFVAEHEISSEASRHA